MEAQVLDSRTRQLLHLLATRTRLLVLTHANPDPDSLGSAMGLRLLAEARADLPTTFAYCGRVMRAENREMVKLCEIDMVPQEELDIREFDCLALVDTQPGFGHTHLPSGRSIDIVVDHHVPPETDTGQSPSSFVDVRTYVGATSSMVTGYLLDAGVEIPKPVATALFYGVKTDTADLSRNVSELDERAYDHLSSRVDRQALARITTPELSPEYYRILREALHNVRIYGSLILCSLGKIAAPEMVAEVADLLLRLEGRQTVFCGGFVGNVYYVSLRTELDYDAYYLMRGALGGEGSFGGHGSVAGGSVTLPDDDTRTQKRFERRLERNIRATMGLGDETVRRLGGARD